MSEFVRIERQGAVGIVTLAREKALNALDHAMIRAISTALHAWRDDPGIAGLLIKSADPRAFCAGGDVRAAVITCRQEGPLAAARFFRDEYEMNWRLADFGKPVISLMDGITMGGGCGLSLHGSHRVATERTDLAMPEGMIGFFPDVGAGTFLSRCPASIGTYMALTGARLSGDDALFAGLCTHLVASGDLAGLEHSLVAELQPGPEAGAQVDALLQPFSRGDGQSSLLAAEKDRIAAHFGNTSLDAVLVALQADASGWGAEKLELIRQRSPLSCHLAFELLRRAAGLSLAEDLELEFRLACHSLLGGEFAEGVRALLIDKDKAPRWRHAAIEEVTPAEIASFFAPLEAPFEELRPAW